MPNDTQNKTKVTKLNRGDVVYIATFNHPAIVLKNCDGFSIACSITSDSECREILEPCRSRMFPNSYITKNLFTISAPCEQLQLRGLYDNNRHLDKVYEKLKLIL